MCSDNGCCFPSNVTCICDPGWTGSSCEYWTGPPFLPFSLPFILTASLGTYDSRFVTVDPLADQFPNGWGNGYALYLQNNAKIDHGLSLTISNASCPSGKKMEGEGEMRLKEMEERERIDGRGKREYNGSSQV